MENIMKISTLISYREYENGESYLSTSGAFFSLSAARYAMKEAISNALSDECQNYGVKNEEELKTACSSFANKSSGDVAFLKVDSHSYSWQVSEVEITGTLQLTGGELGKAMMNTVNTFNVDEKMFASFVANEHRTLQQSAMRLMTAAIRALAQNTPDARNEATVALAKAICNLPEAQNGLPMI